VRQTAAAVRNDAAEKRENDVERRRSGACDEDVAVLQFANPLTFCTTRAVPSKVPALTPIPRTTRASLWEEESLKIQRWPSGSLARTVPCRRQPRRRRRSGRTRNTGFFGEIDEEWSDSYVLVVMVVVVIDQVVIPVVVMIVLVVPRFGHLAEAFKVLTREGGQFPYERHKTPALFD
jgi:hypothetical protein